MPRKNFSKETLARRFHHAGGRCEWVEPTTGIRCDAVLVPGRWHGDHDNPDALTGEPTFENCRCLCLHHHAIKTKKDIADIAQAKRRDASNVGVPRVKSKIKSRGFDPVPRSHEGRELANGIPAVARQYVER